MLLEAEQVEPPKPRRYEHPLRCFIWLRPGFTVVEGMNWLQDRGWISDNCIEPEDVAPIDARRVLVAAKAEHLIPLLRHWGDEEAKKEYEESCKKERERLERVIHENIDKIEAARIEALRQSAEQPDLDEKPLKKRKPLRKKKEP